MWNIFIAALLFEFGLAGLMLYVLFRREKKPKEKGEKQKVFVKKPLLIPRHKEQAKSSSFILFGLAIFGLLLAYMSLDQVRIQEMPTNFAFLLALPLGYWIGTVIIVASIFFMFPLLENRASLVIFIISCVFLMVSLRMIFPVISSNPSVYEPDTFSYMNIIQSWQKTGVSLGVEGNYQHDYPLSFLIAYFFVVAGVPIDTFFRWSPAFVYGIDIFLIYLICKQVFPKNNTLKAMACLLFSMSSFPYWITPHYCPDLLGTIFYLSSLYLSIRFAKEGAWNLKNLTPVLATVILLILAHHLNTLYLTVTLLGLGVSAKLLKGNATAFFFSGVYTYTLWFLYGSFMYPSFFNIYAWLGFTWGSPVTQAGQMGLPDFILGLIYPLVVTALFVSRLLVKPRIISFSIIKDWVIKSDVKAINIKSIRANFEAFGFPLVYIIGFTFVFALIPLGFVIAALMPTRILEVLLVGMYPIASKQLIRLFGGTSRKKKILLFSLLIFAALTSALRYNSAIQRRISYASQ